MNKNWKVIEKELRHDFIDQIKNDPAKKLSRSHEEIFKEGI